MRWAWSNRMSSDAKNGDVPNQGRNVGFQRPRAKKNIPRRDLEGYRDSKENTPLQPGRAGKIQPSTTTGYANRAPPRPVFACCTMKSIRARTAGVGLTGLG